VLDDRGLTGRQDKEEGCVKGWKSATDHIAGWGRAIHTDTDERARLDLDEQDDNNNDELNYESRLIGTWEEGRLPDFFDLLGAVQTM